MNVMLSVNEATLAPGTGALALKSCNILSEPAL